MSKTNEIRKKEKEYKLLKNNNSFGAASHAATRIYHLKNSEAKIAKDIANNALERLAR